MATLEFVVNKHKQICDSARSLIEMKGHDYNKDQQKTGDTLYNLKVSKILGVTNTATQGILTRLGDKYMRLISLTKDLNTMAHVKTETIWDTIQDMINYSIYDGIIYEEECGKI